MEAERRKERRLGSLLGIVYIIDQFVMGGKDRVIAARKLVFYNFRIDHGFVDQGCIVAGKAVQKIIVQGQAFCKLIQNMGEFGLAPGNVRETDRFGLDDKSVWDFFVIKRCICFCGMDKRKQSRLFQVRDKINPVKFVKGFIECKKSSKRIPDETDRGSLQHSRIKDAEPRKQKEDKNTEYRTEPQTAH